MPNLEETIAQLTAELETARKRISDLEAAVSGTATAETPDESGLWFRSLINTIPDLVWLKDRNGVYLSCNHAFEHLFGAKTRDIIGKTDYDFVDKDLADFFRAHDRKAMDAGRPSVNEENLVFAGNGYQGLFETIKTPMADANGKLIDVLGVARDITARKRAEEAVEKRLVTLTRPMGDAQGVTFEEMFSLPDIQRLQDEFARATGVASLITRPDGSPITTPTNFCRLCSDIIRKTEKGLANCYKSDSALGKVSTIGPKIQPCMSGGLWDAGAGITVGGRHIANWLIGQVRDATQTEESMRAYARSIGADEDEAARAFMEVPAMSRERFGQVSQALFTLASQLSSIAYQNIQQARFIADLKRAEEALRESEERYALAINGTSDGIWDINLRTGEVYFSPRWKRILGYSDDEMENSLEEWKSRIHPDDREKVLLEVERCANGDTPSFEIEYRLRHKDGNYRWILGRGASLSTPQGEVVRLAGALTDITERRRIMEVMLQAEKMLSVGGLAAGMAHEINNPLGAILQSAQVVLRRLDPANETNQNIAAASGCAIADINSYLQRRQVLDFLDGIREAGVRAAKIVSNMLEFSRKNGINLAPSDINAVLDKSVELAGSDYELKKTYGFRTLTITRDYQSDLPPVNCVEVQLEQVFMNILRNAAQAMPEILNSAAAPRIDLSTRRDGNQVVIEIADNGRGMDEATRQHIFEPFFTTKAPGLGTGLGLSVSYFIITTTHGGSLEVESAPGQGARFIIRLPLGTNGA